MQVTHASVSGLQADWCPKKAITTRKIIHMVPSRIWKLPCKVHEQVPGYTPKRADDPSR
jgi:hypothetical protein